MKYFFISIILLLPLSLSAYEQEYGQLLNRYVEASVKDGLNVNLVDYEGWGSDSLHEQALGKLQKVDHTHLSGDAKMAFWINAYNLLTVDLIIKTGEQKSIKNQGSLFKNVWKTHTWFLFDREYTLDEIEHRILRPMGDPRIHMAINCASLSCPDLRKEVYTSEKLDGQLEEQVDILINDSTKGVSRKGSDLTVSAIFKWFVADFGGEAGALAFLAQHRSELEGSKIAGYLNYDWALNSQS